MELRSNRAGRFRLNLMLVIVLISYLFGVVVHAWADAQRTDNQKPVSHILGSLLYIGYCLILFIIWGELPQTKVIDLIALPALTRAAFFDPLYNRLIGKGWLYEGVPKPKNKSSLIDRIEKWLGLPVWFYRLFYFAAYLIYVIWIYF